MDILSQLFQGFGTAVTPMNLLWSLLGCAIGTAVGVLPGIGPAVAVAMLLPITSQVDVISSMIFFAGISFTTVPCTAGPPPPSCSIRPAKPPAW